MLKKLLILLIFFFFLSCKDDGAESKTVFNQSDAVVKIQAENASNMQFIVSNQSVKPDFIIITPKQNQIYESSTVQLEMLLENIQNAAFKISIDDASPELVKTTKKIFILNPGEHNVSVELMKDEKTSYAVKKTVSFTNNYVKPPENFGFDIKFPVEGYGVKGDIIAVRLVLNEFSIDTIGAGNREGRGHFHFYLDGSKKPLEVDSATFTIKDLSAGTHVLEVEMVKSDHSSYGLKKKVNFEAQVITSKT
ncbi:hypothetical protein HYV79_03060 [Candidatus Woesearchaeota archaeon]|nr:hypothetical protein [Candidatus Woesearchaeota archaeon]